MRSRLTFFLRWSLLTSLAWAISLALLFYAMTNDVHDLEFVAASGPAFVAGIVGMALLIGLAQAWVLRHILRRAFWWLPATVAGALLGMLLAELVYRRGMIDQRSWFYAVAFIALPVALLQYLVLKPASPRSWLWVLLKLLLFPIAFYGGIMLSFLFGTLSTLLGSYDAVPWIAGMSAGVPFIMGSALVLLLVLGPAPEAAREAPAAGQEGA